MYDLISRFIERMNPEDIKNFATKQEIDLSDDEINFIYSFLKKNWQELLGNPNALIMSRYRNQFSPENYEKINSLVNFYRSRYSGYTKR